MLHNNYWSRPLSDRMCTSYGALQRLMLYGSVTVCVSAIV